MGSDPLLESLEALVRGDAATPEPDAQQIRAAVAVLLVDVVLADRTAVDRPDTLAEVSNSLGARLVLANLADADDPTRHDPLRLAAAYRDVME